jgi:hypothetical protein
MRHFDTGATRDVDNNKLDFEGFMHPLVLERYAQYMHKHRFQADGKVRDSDNWQKGMPLDVYMKSGFRHFFDWWKEHRGTRTKDGLEEALCALLFNVMGYLYETLKGKQVVETHQDWRTVYAKETLEVSPLTEEELAVIRGERLGSIKRYPVPGEAKVASYEEEYHSGVPGEPGLEHG